LAFIVLDLAVELHSVMKYPGQERHGPAGQSLGEKSENDKHVGNQTYEKELGLLVLQKKRLRKNCT